MTVIIPEELANALIQYMMNTPTGTYAAKYPIALVEQLQKCETIDESPTVSNTDRQSE